MSLPLAIPFSLGGGPLGPLGEDVWQEASAWAFIGEVAGQPVAWSTEPVEGFEPRLVEPPAAWALGPSASAEGAPELPTSSLLLDNSDAALNRWLLGIPEGSGSAADEYLGPSFLDLVGQLHLVTVTTSGDILTRPMSPLMRAAGAVTTSPGRIQLALRADGDAALGPVRGLRTLREWGDADWQQVWMGTWVEQLFAGEPPAAPWELIRHLPGSVLETVVPWTHGAAPLRLIPLEEHGVRIYLAGIRPAYPDQAFSLFDVRLVSEGGGESYEASRYELAIEMTTGEWLLLYMLPDSDDIPTDLWMVPVDRAARSPTEILTALFAAQAPGGLDAVDTESLDATAPGLAHLAGALSGVVESEVTVHEILQHACPGIGWRTWLGEDGRLRFTLRDPPREEWEGQPPAAVLGPPDDYPITTDGMPSWQESLPTDPDASGSAVERVSIDWSSWATTVYPQATRPTLSAAQTPGGRRGGELRIDGSWIHPDRGALIVALGQDRGTDPVRTLSLATSLAILDVPIGSYLHLGSEWVHVIGGWGVDGRLARLMRIEIRPADMCAVVTLEDMGAAQDARLGLLDSREHWTLPRPPGGITMRPYVMSGTLYGLIEGTAITPLAGETIWAAPSTHPDHRGECSYRVVAATPEGIVVTPPPTAPGGDPIAVADADWRWMRTYTTSGKSTRPDRIAAASDETGAFSDGDDAFRFIRV